MFIIISLFFFFTLSFASNITYTVSGLSSGAYFAVQHTVAFSSKVVGLGVVAGGPYYCALDSEETAETACLDLPNEIDISTLVSKTKEFVDSSYIDDTSNLENLRAYLYSGTLDSVVKSGVVKKCQEYLDEYVSNSATVFFQNNISSEHAMITNFYGNACPILSEPYINNCHFDLAGAILEWIYGKLKNPIDSKEVPYNNVIQFDQSKFFPSGKTAADVSLQTTAFAYIPTECEYNPISSNCKLHVVYHGCEQDLNTKYDGHSYNDTYVRNSGYNEWAEPNNIIILYPQADKNDAKGNPDGCWDWWGYNGKNYAWKDGDQLYTVNGMVNYILGD